MIIETTANQFYRVEELRDPDLAHCWQGKAVKLVKGQWIEKAKARFQLVSKAHCLRIVA
jgi:hypothetical protein